MNDGVDGFGVWPRMLGAPSAGLSVLVLDLVLDLPLGGRGESERFEDDDEDEIEHETSRNGFRGG